jgi:hypothetical protein
MFFAISNRGFLAGALSFEHEILIKTKIVFYGGIAAEAPLF